MTTSLLSDQVALTVCFLNFFAGFTLVPFLKTQFSLGFWATNLLVISHLSDFGLSLSSYALLRVCVLNLLLGLVYPTNSYCMFIMSGPVLGADDQRQASGRQVACSVRSWPALVPPC